MKSLRLLTGAALLPGIGAALLPKCPMCVAGYLSLFGLGAGALGEWLPTLRNVGFAFCLAALAVLVGFRLRQPRSCCTPER